jgi:hypothetical protein
MPQRSHPAPKFRLYGLGEATERNYQVRSISRPDYRTRLGRQQKALRQDLLDHFGDNIDIIQRELIEQCVELKTEVSELRARRAAGGISELDSRRLGAASNALARCLIKLGFREKAAVDRIRAETALMRAADPKMKKL